VNLVFFNRAPLTGDFCSIILFFETVSNADSTHLYVPNAAGEYSDEFLLAIQADFFLIKPNHVTRLKANLTKLTCK
jgi:hypothetical protein